MTWDVLSSHFIEFPPPRICLHKLELGNTDIVEICSLNVSYESHRLFHVILLSLFFCLI